MVEKINMTIGCLPAKYISGYFRPKGKYAKRVAHKKVRKTKDVELLGLGAQNKIGVYWEWS